MFLEENEMILKIANWEYRNVKVGKPLWDEH